jgi:hypothetical protein
VTAGFEGNKCGSSGDITTGILDCGYLSVIGPGFLVIALSDDTVLPDDYRTHRGVGARPTLAQVRQVKRLLHEAGVYAIQD